MFPRCGFESTPPAWGTKRVLGRALGSRDPFERSCSPGGVLDTPRGLASSREVSGRQLLEDDHKESGRPASGVLEGPGRGDARLVLRRPELFRAVRPGRDAGREQSLHGSAVEVTRDSKPGRELPPADYPT